jgi:AcrR family transcriptional regulator
LTSRYFYESFSDTNDLLISLYEELAEQAMTNTAQAMSTAGTDLRSRIRNGVQAGITFVVEDDRRSRYLLVHATAVPELNRRRRQLIGHVAESWAKTVQPAYDFADESSALAAVSRFVVGGLIELSTAFVQGDVVMPADDLVESITDMAIAAIEAIALRSPTSS